MNLRRTVVTLVCAASTLALTVLSTGCDPYDRYHSGEFYAGAVDPVKFPASFLGTGNLGGAMAPPDGTKGGNFFLPATATVNGATVQYYAFPVSNPPAMNAMDIAPPASVPNAYVFDPSPSTMNPFPAKQKCTPPAGYVYDERTDAYHLDQQGNIFTGLPDGTGLADGATYDPLVAEVPVTTTTEACQSIKSEATLIAQNGQSVSAPLTTAAVDAPATGMPDGKYLAWAIIDPSAAVYADASTMPGSNPGLSVQHWGWFNHYMVAYIDGGYVATSGSGATTTLNTQDLYFPDSDMGPGMGHDVMEFKRGDAGYSPLCRVFSYHSAAPLTSVAAIKASGTAITLQTFMYCLQAQ